MIFIALFLSLNAIARPAPTTTTPPRKISPPRAFVPDDADPCDFERFKADATLAQWVRDISPNTATAAKCHHSPAKILPVLSGLFAELDRHGLSLEGGAKFDPRAAALTGYQVDSMIEVRKDGQRYVGLLLKSGVNGPAVAQIYRAP